MFKKKKSLILEILGDPGLGKSQLLQAAASVSPRGIYVCGNATTNAGLTVAVVKDSMTGDYAFEAGKFFFFFFFFPSNLPFWSLRIIDFFSFGP